MTNHDIDVLVRAATDGPDVQIPDGWGQGRATFGGVVGGALVARALGELDADPHTLRSVTINFLAPVTPGPARLECEVLRRGSSATQVEVRLRQDDGSGTASLRALALVSFGADRPCSVELVPGAEGGRPEFGPLMTMSDLPGPIPDFLRHVDLRLARGGYAFTASPTGTTAGWMRFSEAPEDFSLAHFVTLVDAWPPTPAQLFAQPIPMSTMTWTLEILSAPEGTPESLWWYDAVTDCVHDGYGHTEARVFDEAGRLAAVSRQTVAIFG